MKIFFKNNPGFTLAETLITISIIGIVAAMTLSTLINNHQKKVLHSQFLKTYSDIQNATKLFQVKEGLTVYEYSQQETDPYSNKTMKKFIEHFKMGEAGSIIGTINTYNEILGYAPKSLAGEELTSQPCDRSITTNEIGGRIFTMDDPVSQYDNPFVGPKLCVDINGKKGPNKYGYDWFVFAFTPNGGVKPFIGSEPQNIGTELTNPSTKCNYTINQPYTCAYFAITDTSPLDPTKKYWTDFLK